jgi:hypothetical protein
MKEGINLKALKNQLGEWFIKTLNCFLPNVVPHVLKALNVTLGPLWHEKMWIFIYEIDDKNKGLKAYPWHS